MKTFALVLLLMLIAGPCMLSSFGGSGGLRAQNLNQFQWKNRVAIIFTPTIDDPNFLRQYQLLSEKTDELEERRLKIITVTADGEYENSGLFPDESLSRWYYDHFSVQPYQMEIILVGMDGYEKFRAKNTVIPPSVIWETIDDMPMRRRELIQGTGNKSQIGRENSANRNADRY